MLTKVKIKVKSFNEFYTQPLLDDLDCDLCESSRLILMLKIRKRKHGNRLLSLHYGKKRRELGRE